MDLSTIAKKTWAENILFAALVELTYRCNLDCSFCYNDTSLKGTPLSLEQYYKFFEDLAEMQVLNLTLSGGEPLAHPHFFELGAKGKELGFVVRVKSNGHALRGTLARRLKEEVDPFVVEVSMHGAKAETHDRQTRVAGSFDRLMANIPEMQSLGLRVRINSTMTAWNETEAEGMMDVAERLGVALQIDPEVTARDDGDQSPLDISPSREGILNMFRAQLARAKSVERAPVAEVGRQDDRNLGPIGADKNCGAGSSTLAVDPYGEVYPCVQWRWSAGNLHRQSIREIWGGSGALSRIRELNKEAKKAVDAHRGDAPTLSFCPGSAELQDGDPLHVNPRLIDKAKLLEQARAELRGEQAPPARRELLPIVQ